MKKILLFLVNLLIINALCHGQSITLVPSNPANPTKGTLDYNNATNQLQYWNNSAWIPITNAAAGTGWALGGNNISNSNSGNVGIGTNTPKAFFNVAAGKTVVFGADSSGLGKKLIWYASKGALRVGDSGGTYFDNNNNNVGINTFAMGSQTVAVGDNSMALGFHTLASGSSAVAMGYNTTASGDYSTASGYQTSASGPYSFANGEGCMAYNWYTTAMGFESTASGFSSVAIGNHTIASGASSTAIGLNTTASGAFSTALGVHANTNNHLESFCISGEDGVNNDIETTNTADHQMMMRFDNYTFYVAGTNNYAYITPASNGWAYTSDKNRKENFEELNGENILNKISKIPFFSWNFKDKEVKQFRHYGIMAQDFYSNFGKDNHGVIGNDTTVSALDLLGVAYSGIKALEKRTEDLQIQNQLLVEEIAQLKAIIQPKRRKFASNQTKEPRISDKLVLK